MLSRRGWLVGRKFGAALFALVVLFGAGLASPTPASATGAAYIDPLLQAALATAAPTDTFAAVAQLDAVPTAFATQLVRATGVQAVPFTALPDLVVQGTKVQLTALAAL